MATRMKTFDCVDMKYQVQNRLLHEYETHKSETLSYFEFLRLRTDRSDWIKKFRDKMSLPSVG